MRNYAQRRFELIHILSKTTSYCSRKLIRQGNFNLACRNVDYFYGNFFQTSTVVEGDNLEKKNLKTCSALYRK